MTALTHIARQVVDVAACVDFYTRYCGMTVVHSRREGQVAWLAEPGRETEFILVLIGGGAGAQQPETVYDHLGFALDSREAVDAIAARAAAEGLSLIHI